MATHEEKKWEEGAIFFFFNMHFKKNVSRDYNNRIIRTCFLKLCVDFFLDILTFLELYEEKRSKTITTHFSLKRGPYTLLS